VDGPRNYDVFLPSPKSVIRADSFSSAFDLAQYLIYLSTNRTAYLEYLPWKTNRTFVFRESFLRMFGEKRSERERHEERLCGLKRRAQEKKRNHYDADLCESPGKWKPPLLRWLDWVLYWGNLGTVLSNVVLVVFVLVLFIFAFMWRRIRKNKIKK
jgi:hypothetical protein